MHAYKHSCNHRNKYSGNFLETEEINYKHPKMSSLKYQTVRLISLTDPEISSSKMNDSCPSTYSQNDKKRTVKVK